MRTQSAISKGIEIADQEAQYDASVKRLLSQKIILAWILKECVSEFKPFSIPQIMKCIEGDPQVAVAAVDQDEEDYVVKMPEEQILGMNAEDSTINEGKIYYDIRFSAIVPGNGESVQLIINIEAQKSDKTPYPLIKRAIYYVSRMISAQKNRNFHKSHYENLRKVYSIWIQMDVDANKANTITKYRIVEENIVGTVNERESNYDLLTIMMLGLGKADEAKDEPILRLLDVLLSTETTPEKKKEILEQDFDIPMSTKIQMETNIMCNLGEGIRERAFEQATRAMRISTVQNLMQSLKLSAEEAINAMGVPDEDKQPLLDIISMEAAQNSD